MDQKIFFSRMVKLFRCPWIQQWLVILLTGLLIFLWSSEDRRDVRPLIRSLFQKRRAGSYKISDETQTLSHSEASPDHQTTDAKTSTSPDHSTFVINDFKDTYYVGDKLHVTIVAKDFAGVPKHHGGDLFGARVFSKKLKASVFGEVLDHQNGTYSAWFTLPWAGRALLAVYLIYSSEAIQLRQRHQHMDSDQIYFHGYFEGRNPQGDRVEERAECQIKWDGVVISSQRDCCCEYQDAHMGLAWQCHRPSSLPCDTLVEYYIGGQRHRLTTVKKKREHVTQWLKGDKRQIRLTASKEKTGVRELCKPGLPTPTPAGFYMNNVWTWFVCATHPFTVTDTAQSLKDKHIYFMGDATSRQWFDYLIQAVPTLKRTYPDSPFQTGPLLAVDEHNNISMTYSTRGLPLRCLKTPLASVHHMSNKTDEVVGGPQAVIVYTLNFKDYPLAYYVQHVSLVHCAVVELLKHEPETKVIITTGPKDFFVSDWFSKQLDETLREAFRDVGVYILNVWQMTATDIHPVQVILKNEIDILLSFISSK